MSLRAYSFSGRMPSESIVPPESWPCHPSTIRLSRLPQSASRRSVQATRAPPPAAPRVNCAGTFLKFGIFSSCPWAYLFGIAHATALIFDLSGLMPGRLLNASGDKLPAAESISS